VAGKIPELKINRLLLRNASAVGVAWGAFLELDGSYMGEAGRKLAAMMEAGHLDPPIGAKYRFEELPDALARLSRGEIPGKAIVELRAEGP
jgi:NADPH2:quinone reductase